MPSTGCGACRNFNMNQCRNQVLEAELRKEMEVMEAEAQDLRLALDECEEDLKEECARASELELALYDAQCELNESRGQLAPPLFPFVWLETESVRPLLPGRSHHRDCPCKRQDWAFFNADWWGLGEGWRCVVQGDLSPVAQRAR